jgi:hypothetical protein
MDGIRATGLDGFTHRLTRRYAAGIDVKVNTAEYSTFHTAFACRDRAGAVASALLAGGL